MFLEIEILTILVWGNLCDWASSNIYLGKILWPFHISFVVIVAKKCFVISEENKNPIDPQEAEV